MELRDLLETIWERKVVVGLVFVFCVIGAAAYADSRPKQNYESTATIAFLPDLHQGQFAPPETLSALLSTYAVIAESSRNLTAASAILGHPLTGSVSTSTTPGSWILGINSEDTSPGGAAETAHAATEALFNTIHRNGVVVPTIINPPVASTTPVESRPPQLIISVAAVLGLIAGVLLVLLLDNLSGSADSARERPAVSTERSS